MIMITEAIKGVLLGLAVGAFNYYIAVSALSKGQSYDTKAKAKIGGVFFLRYGLNFLTLFLVHKNTPMLIGAGFALVLMSHIMIVKNIKRRG